MEDDVVMFLQFLIWGANTEAARHAEMNDDVLLERERDEDIFSPAGHTSFISQWDIL